MSSGWGAGAPGPSAPAPGTDKTYYTEDFTLSPTDISNGYVTLSKTPTSAVETSVTPIGGVEQDYGTDYTVSGTTLSWSGLGMAAFLVSGNVLRILYPILA